MEEKKNKTGFALAGAVVAAVTASLCCILPIVAAFLGLTALSASGFFERWRPYFLGVTFGLLGVGFYLAFRARREACEAGSVCARTPVGRWNHVALWLVTALALVLAAFPRYSGWIARAVTASGRAATLAPQATEAGTVLKIDGMTCSACAALLEKKLSQIPGVRSARVSFEKKEASLAYDPRAVDPSRFAKAITEAGYRAASAHAVSK